MPSFSRLVMLLLMIMVVMMGQALSYEVSGAPADVYRFDTDELLVAGIESSQIGTSGQVGYFKGVYCFVLGDLAKEEGSLTEWVDPHNSTYDAECIVRIEPG